MMLIKTGSRLEVECRNPDCENTTEYYTKQDHELDEVVDFVEDALEDEGHILGRCEECSPAFAKELAAESAADDQMRDERSGAC